MKTIYLYILTGWLVATGIVCGQTSTQNYVRTRTWQDQSGTQAIEKVDYADGLGRPSQTVYKQVTPSNKNLVTLQEYDAFGREKSSWLPAVITDANAGYVATATLKTNSRSSNGNDQSPFTMTIYEDSPFHRILKETGAGQEWHTNDKAVKIEYLTNNNSVSALTCLDYWEEVRNVQTNSFYFYQSGLLKEGIRNIIKRTDEEGCESYEFKDDLGRTHLYRQIDNGEFYDTYYVWDIHMYNTLLYVVPPELSKRFIEVAMDFPSIPDGMDYVYIYEYDKFNRCIAKKIPGSDWIYYVYDQADRIIFSQNGEQRKKEEWAFSIPDAFGRVVLTGVCKNTIDFIPSRYSPIPFENTIIKARRIEQTNTLKGYAIEGVTLVEPVVLSANYYDNYSFMGTNGVPSNATTQYENESGFNTRYTGGSAGMLTGQLTALLEGNSVSSYLYSIYYYDNQGRVIQQKSNTHLTGGVEKAFTAYSFTGNPLQQKFVHIAGTKTTTELYTYTYDKAARLTQLTHKLDSNPAVVIASNTYDELGRLQTLQHAGHANLKITYTYNVRSWLTQKKSNHLVVGPIQYTYGGNLQKFSWRQEAQTASYDFTYDQLSRLTQSSYTGTGSFNTSYSYDQNGNIKRLTRYGLLSSGSYGVIDNLTATYTGNQLKNVTDSGPNVAYNGSADFKDYTKGSGVEYTFDANGSMTKDLNKGISVIQYNCLNLPHTIDLKNTMAEARNTYAYTAGGVKVSVTHRWNSQPSANATAGSAVTASALDKTKRTDYVGNKIYEDGTLKRILFNGGYIEGGVYYFYLTDHLGSTRAVANASGSIIQRTQYYPFGTAFADKATTEQNKQPYKYTGKEIDSDQGLNLYDYHARLYDPAIGRFTTIDPMAEQYYHLSPYAYCANNPLRFTDPTGMWIEDEDTERSSFFSTEEGQNWLKNLMNAFSINKHIKWFFGVDAITPNEGENKDDFLERRAEAHQRGEETIEQLETVIDVLDMVVPYSSLLQVGLGIEANNMDAVWAAAPFALLDIAGGGAGKKTRGLWKLTKEGSSSVKWHSRYKNIYKSASDGLWWSKDLDIHGGSTFKVFIERKDGLHWYKDADKYGDFITNKHKSPVGKSIKWGQLKTIK
ncbi:MAG: RHS repeat-associated core domain-containing protein [Tannerellaceae bacterium]|nr:RHS repeat-associated core domain-containing protein [Tannerellaceae bacterium]